MVAKQQNSGIYMNRLLLHYKTTYGCLATRSKHG